jgi:hypothetical protein
MMVVFERIALTSSLEHLARTGLGRVPDVPAFRGPLACVGHPSWLRLAYHLLVVAIDFIMGQSMCLGLGERAKKHRAGR